MNKPFSAMDMARENVQLLTPYMSARVWVATGMSG